MGTDSTRKRHPLLAGILALLGPGLGHLYAGSIRAAIGWLLAVAVLIISCWFLVAAWNAAPLNVFLPIGLLLAAIVLHIVHAVLSTRRQPQDYHLRRFNRWYVYIGWWIVAIAIVRYVPPAIAGYEAFVVPATSMEKALVVGDQIIADMSAYNDAPPDRGDVAVFIFPHDGVTRYVKRCVAVAGDTLELIDKQLYINGTRSEDPPTVIYADTNALGQQAIKPRGPGNQDSRDNFGLYIVPDDFYFFMGDNRDNSYDSRYWGPVHRDLILGRVVRIYGSADVNRIGLRPM